MSANHALQAHPHGHSAALRFNFEPLSGDPERWRMYRLRTKRGKRDPLKNWELPEKVFFACGACHVLAYAFLTNYPNYGFAPIWIRPKRGYTGNHIAAVREWLAFDYHGYSEWPTLLAHMKRRANQHWPGWDADLIQLPEEVLISEAKSRTYEGLWLREPMQFRFDALARARAFVRRFPRPPLCGKPDKRCNEPPPLSAGVSEGRFQT
jgi:hypothetical protein